MKKFSVATIAFDLDGTLIDSESDIANALNKTLTEVGYPSLPLPLISKHVGRGVRDLISGAVREAGEPDREREVRERFFVNYSSGLLLHTHPYEGVMESLATLAGRFTLGVVTNKPAIFTLPILEGLGMAPYFGQAVYSGDTFPKLKPDPSALYAMGKLYGTARSNLLIVGDSAIDIETGQNAGAHTAGVTYGFRPVEELRKAGAEALFDRFDQLLPSLEGR